MQIQVHGRVFVVTDAIREHAERHLRFALTRFGADVRRVTVELSELAGPACGSSKICRIDVAFRKSENVVIENFDTDVYVAITRAAERAGRAASRSLAQLNDSERFGKRRRGGGAQ